MPLQVGVLASGRGSNFAALHDATQAGGLDAELVVLISDVGDAQVLARARRRQVPAVHIAPAEFESQRLYEEALAETLAQHQVQLICLAGYMRILGRGFVQRFAGRIMNIHPSLLPAFQGLHAQQQALDYGVKVSGCSVHFVDEGVDTGPIILQGSVPVAEGDDAQSLSRRILAVEHRLYPRAVQLYAQGALRLEGRRVRIRPNESAKGG